MLFWQMDDRGKISFEFDRIEADLFGFKVPLPNFNADAGFVEVQVNRGTTKLCPSHNSLVLTYSPVPQARTRTPSLIKL